MDAPWHYASTTDGGKRAMTIDEMPLDWFLRPGVKLDFRHMESGHVVTARELEEACRAIVDSLIQRCDRTRCDDECPLTLNQ